jgi:hypothetical protein
MRTTQPPHLLGPLIHFVPGTGFSMIEIHRIDLGTRSSNLVRTLDIRGIQGIRELHLFGDGQLIFRTKRQLHLVRNVLEWDGTCSDASHPLESSSRQPMEANYSDGQVWFLIQKKCRVPGKSSITVWRRLRFDPAGIDGVEIMEPEPYLDDGVGNWGRGMDTRLPVMCDPAGLPEVAPASRRDEGLLAEMRPFRQNWVDREMGSSRIYNEGKWQVIYSKFKSDLSIYQIDSDVHEFGSKNLKCTFSHFPGSLANSFLWNGRLYWRERWNLVSLPLEAAIRDQRGKQKELKVARLGFDEHLHYCGEGVVIQKMDRIKIFHLDELDWVNEVRISFDLLEKASGQEKAIVERQKPKPEPKPGPHRRSPKDFLALPKDELD